MECQQSDQVSDGDGLLDPFDNCSRADNADQLDTDADGIGNACDADFDNCLNLP